MDSDVRREEALVELPAPAAARLDAAAEEVAPFAAAARFDELARFGAAVEAVTPFDAAVRLDAAVAVELFDAAVEEVTPFDAAVRLDAAVVVELFDAAVRLGAAVAVAPFGAAVRFGAAVAVARLDEAADAAARFGAAVRLGAVVAVVAVLGRSAVGDPCALRAGDPLSPCHPRRAISVPAPMAAATGHSSTPKAASTPSAP
ncbi:hypothetical protein [Nonomuraea sp. NPDC049141]|uniref:hypothetical protein n=1 Tax=Nonomuraea sp. NPDC049141 TaxID=3155500 RepID=UPI0034085E8C